MTAQHLTRGRALIGALSLPLAGSLPGCASIEPSAYSDQKPALDLKRYFDGTPDGWGMFQDRSGGSAEDVVGQAEGIAAGNALRWRYVMALPIDGRVWHVDLDDWMFLIDERVLLNRATMSKFGLRLGEVTLSLTRR